MNLPNQLYDKIQLLNRFILPLLAICLVHIHIIPTFIVLVLNVLCGLTLFISDKAYGATVPLTPYEDDTVDKANLEAN